MRPSKRNAGNRSAQLKSYFSRKRVMQFVCVMSASLQWEFNSSKKINSHTYAYVTVVKRSMDARLDCYAS